MNNEDFVSYEVAQALKKAGFDWPTQGYYYKGNCADDEVWYYTMNPADDHNHRDNPRVWSAPTMAQAQKWLREVKGIAINTIAHDGGLYQWEDVILPNAPEYKHFIYPDMKQYDTYESALAAGIEAAMKLIEEGKR